MVKTFMPYLQRYRWLLLISYGAGVMLTAASSLTPLAGKIFFDNVLPCRVPEAFVALLNNTGFFAIAGFVTKVTTDVYGFAFFALFFALLLGVLQTIRGLADFFIQQRLTAQITTDLFARVMHASLQKHQGYAHGYLNARIIADSGSFESLARTLLPALANNLLRFCLGLTILSSINLRMTMICLLTAPVYVLTNYFFTPLARRLAHQSAEKSAENQAFVQNSLQGIETIKGFNLETSRINGFAGRLNNLIAIKLQYFKAGLGSSTIARIAQICCLLVLIVNADGLYRVGKLSAGDIIAFIGYIGYLAGPLASLAMLYLNLQPTLVSVNRVKEVLEFADESSMDSSDFPALSLVPKGLAARPEKLNLKNLSYYHNSDSSRVSVKSNGSGDSNKKVSPEVKLFNGLNMEFKRGQLSVIDWSSGAGKTTLARLLLKFLQPESGEITIDGVSLAEINTAELRAITGYKPQADFFFAGSIRENLLVAKSDATESDILKALQLCCAEEFVLSRAGDLEAQLSDGAMNLSEGQRQRLAMARAVLKDPGILILDEPFAAIDQKTAEKIMENLQGFINERICIIMSHKSVLLS